MSRDGLAALPRGAMGLSAFVVVVFPDHTHLLFLGKKLADNNDTCKTTQHIVQVIISDAVLVYDIYKGAQWLSGRVLDSRPKGRGFEPHRRHCVVVLEQDTFILA